MRTWFRDYWPWLIVIFWLVGYEIYTIATHQATLSRLVWRAYRDNPWLQWPVMVICLVLLVHFFVRRGSPYPIALLVMGVMLLATYLTRRWFL